MLVGWVFESTAHPSGFRLGSDERQGARLVGVAEF